MKLLDARKLAVREQVTLRFSLAGGAQCLVDKHGIARVPSLTGPPAFDLEDEFAAAQQFTLERSGAPPQLLTRAAMEQLTHRATEPAHAGADHDD